MHNPADFGSTCRIFEMKELNTEMNRIALGLAALLLLASPLLTLHVPKDDAAAAAFASAIAAQQRGTLKGTAYLYKTASQKGKRLVKLKKGNKVTIRSTKGKFYRATYGKRTGYVLKSKVSVAAKPKVKAMKSKGTLRATSPLYTSASTKSKRKATLSKGRECDITGTIGSFYRVKIGGETGYMLKSKVRKGTTAKREKSSEKAQKVSGAGKYSSDDVYLLARCIYGEGRGEPYTGQVAIGAVVLNRMQHSEFPNSIAGVIYQPYAFSIVADGQINLTPNDSALRAARDAINGQDPTSGAIFYYNPDKTQNKFIRSRKVICRIGAHLFCS